MRRTRGPGGGYETIETLDALAGKIDIFLPDMKYATRETAIACAHAPDYPEVALTAIETMLTVSGEPVFAPDGRLLRGTVVRFLLRPGRLLEAKTSLSRVFRLCGNAVIYSLMRQYTPQPGMLKLTSLKIEMVKPVMLISSSIRASVALMNQPKNGSNK